MSVKTANAVERLAGVIEFGHLLAATGGADLLVAAAEEIERLRSAADLTTLHAAAFVRCAATGERPGQALFNALREQAPALAEEIRGREMDPYHVRHGTAVMRADMEWIAARLPTHEASPTVIEIPDMETARRYVGQVVTLGHRRGATCDGGIVWAPDPGALHVKTDVIITAGATTRHISDHVVIRLESDGSLRAWVRDYLGKFAPIGEWAECDKVEKSAWVAEQLDISEADARDLCDRAAWS